MKKAVIVEYSTGAYDDYSTETIFVTENRRKATKYVTKFNKAVKRWKDYYSQFEGDKYGGMKWIKDEHIEKHYQRWASLRRINKCYCYDIEIR